MHIVLWLLKDLCWVTVFKIGGIIMVFPTVFMAIYITIKSWQIQEERGFNLAVICWILANSTWMLGEFFELNFTSFLAAILFVVGLICCGTYLFKYKAIN